MGGAVHVFVCNNITTLVEEVVQYLERTTKLWREDVFETYGFERDTREALAIIGPILQQDKDFHNYLIKYARSNFKDSSNANKKYTTGYLGRIKNIVQHILQGQMYLEEYIEEAKEEKPIRKNIIWFLIRTPAPKKNYRQLHVTEAEQLRSELDELSKDNGFLASPGALVTANQFKDDLSTEAYEFWTKSLGLKTTANWNDFSENYTVLYGKRANSDLKYIREVVFKENSNGGGTKSTTITIYGVITLAREYGFPFEHEPSSSQDNIRRSSTTEEIRTEIAKMIMDMMVEFSSAALQEHFLAVIQWYGKVDRKSETSIQARADEWAQLLKESRRLKDEEKAELHRQVDRVDLARRSISFLYQRYMVIWRIGQISRETLKDVDFPGRARIRDFLRYYLPLDFANYHVIIGAEPEEWYHRKPNVYKFLALLITDVASDEEKLKVRQQEATASSSEGEKKQDSANGGINITPVEEKKSGK
ncbi:hypothetical protein BDA99DRAFT_521223 [Phascolomyces articulosus]|uniref:Uncharacterized protein n=1 Tax=Phascolomyces articulosus TaxID=60185 RepID=A0AAD5JS42_9FUNG|nr:hypothetical protein BDA99DRAFT_521223 [Phascolomyces articulosus]